MGEHARLPFGQPVPPCPGFPEWPQPLVLPLRPAHQVGVDALEQGVQPGPVELAVVVHPSSDDGVDNVGELVQFRAAAQVDAPGADFLAHSLEGVLADRGQEPGEHAGPVPGRRVPGAERVAQEGERRARAVRAASLPVLPDHDPGLVGVQLQPDFGHPPLQCGEDLSGPPFCRAVHNGVVGVTFEFHGWELSFQPFVEPPVPPLYGIVSVLSCDTLTASTGMPRASAAISASEVSEPVRSTLPTMKVMVPSASRRQAAAAGSVPPGQLPAATPIPTFQPFNSSGTSFCSGVLPRETVPALSQGNQASQYAAMSDDPWLDRPL